MYMDTQAEDFADWVLSQPQSAHRAHIGILYTGKKNLQEQVDKLRVEIASLNLECDSYADELGLYISMQERLNRNLAGLPDLLDLIEKYQTED